MSFSLKSNFFLNARGVTFEDGGGVTWTFNPNSNQISASASAMGTVTSIGSTTLTIGGTASVPTVNLSTAQQANIAAGGTALQTASVADSITGAGTVASPLQLSGDAATPGNSFFYGTNASGVKGWYASVAVPSSGAASASVGLTAVAGSGTAYMLANAAPALSQAVAPTWTGVHTFAPSAAANPSRILTSKNTTGGIDDQIQRAGSTANTIGEGPNSGWVDTTATTYSVIQQSGGQTEFWQYNAGWTQVAKFLTTHGFQIAGPLGVNGATPPAQVTGWGTPTGPAVVANFSGTAATLVQCSNAIAELITILKAAGLIGA